MRIVSVFLLLGAVTLLRGQAQAEDSTPDAAALRQAADQAWQARDYATAAAKYEALSGVASDDIVVWYRLGYSLHDLKRYADALPAHERAAALWQRDPHIGVNATYNVACALARLGRAFVDWVTATLPRSKVLLTVCTGAFVPAMMGLLDGKGATTHHSSIPGLRQGHPSIRVSEGVKLVDNGKIVTAGGVSCGIDGALHVVAKLQGMATAKAVADYLEYSWQPETTVPLEQAGG